MRPLGIYRCKKFASIGQSYDFGPKCAQDRSFDNGVKCSGVSCCYISKDRDPSLIIATVCMRVTDGGG